MNWVVAGLFLLGAGGHASAQQGQPAPAPVAGTAQVGVEQRAQLSPQDELLQADTILARIDGAAGTVRRQLEAARAARDVVKTLCLNDKLSQVDVANRSARDRQTALQAAAQRNDTELSSHEFIIMTVLRQRVEQLTAEANQCIGEEMAFIGQTQVTTSTDQTIGGGEDNTVFPPVDVTGIYNPPPPLSETASGGP